VAAGTRLPYPVVVRVVNEQYRSWEKVPSPCDPKNGPAPSVPSARYATANDIPIIR
jgi:hypothetical protein